MSQLPREPASNTPSQRQAYANLVLMRVVSHSGGGAGGARRSVGLRDMCAHATLRTRLIILVYAW